MIAAAGLGALIGILLGLLGGGGSILAVPALVHGAGLTLAAAVPTQRLQRAFAWLVFAIAAFAAGQAIVNPVTA